MAYGEPRSDVATALKEALASGVKVKVEGRVLGRALEEGGYVGYITVDRVLVRYDKKQTGGIPLMLADIERVWLDDGPGQSPGSAAAPVENPPRPKGGGPGKAEPIPEHAAKVPADA